ncbi:antifreeze protein [Mycena vulgaris]|nr:antifreeze protein [Mycena vulgaris]
MICTVFAISLLTAFRTVGALGPAAVNLRTAGNFVILAQSGVSTLTPSVITGAVAVSPIAAPALTGFSLILDSTGQFATSSQVTGKIFAASYAAPTPSTLSIAVGDMGTAFTDANSRPSPNFVNLATGAIGGLVLVPGLYKWTSAVAIASNTTLSGSATDTWIFQVAGTLNIATNAQIILAGGALAKNIVWVVTGAITAAPRSHLAGVILGKTSVQLQTNAVVTGRLLLQTSVSLQQLSSLGSQALMDTDL